MLKDSGLCNPDVDFGRDFTEVWPNIPRGGLRGLQEDIEVLFGETEERISVVLIEAPMGEGKTEAGIYADFVPSRYSSAPSAGMASAATVVTSMGPSMGSGKESVTTTSTGRSSLTPLASALAIMSLQ